MKQSNKKYSYILVQNIYINTQLSVFQIAINLLKNAKPFGLETKIPIPLLNKLPQFITKVIRIIRLCFIFLIKKHKTFNNDTYYSDFFGHVMLKRQLNNVSTNKFVYKIFDLKNKILINEYGDEVSNKEILNDINKITLIEKLEFTPKLIDINIDEKYYIEKYLNLYHPSSKDFKKYYLLTTDIISTIYNKFEIKCISKTEFINSLNLRFPKVLLGGSKLNNKTYLLQKFINDTKNKIIYNPNTVINFAQSHGDLNSKNIFINKNEKYVIDWELLKYRVLFYDIFYVMLIVKRKDFGMSKIEQSIEELIFNSIVRVIYENNFEVKLNHHFIELYLNCFYLTYLDWKLKVYLNHNDNRDVSRRLDEVLLDLKVFQENEEKIISVFKEI